MGGDGNQARDRQNRGTVVRGLPGNCAGANGVIGQCSTSLSWRGDICCGVFSVGWGDFRHESQIAIASVGIGNQAKPVRNAVHYMVTNRSRAQQGRLSTINMLWTASRKGAQDRCVISKRQTRRATAATQGPPAWEAGRPLCTQAAVLTAKSCCRSQFSNADKPPRRSIFKAASRQVSG